MRAAVAQNPTISLQVLEVLSRDAHPFVRAAIRAGISERTYSTAAGSWLAEVAIYGQSAERVAWALARDGFDGPLAELAMVAVGSVAE